MLTLKKDCRIGASINTKLATDDEEPTMEIPVNGVMLEAQELVALVGDTTIWANWYDERAGDKLPEPTWAAKFHAFAFGHKFKDSRVIFALGVSRETLTLESVTLAKIKLQPMVGGLTAFDFVAQCTPDMAKASKLFAHMNHMALIEIKIGERDEGDTVKTQPELGLKLSDGQGEFSDGTKFTVQDAKKPTRKPAKSKAKAPSKAKRKSGNHHAAH